MKLNHNFNISMVKEQLKTPHCVLKNIKRVLI